MVSSPMFDHWISFVYAIVTLKFIEKNFRKRSDMENILIFLSQILQSIKQLCNSLRKIDVMFMTAAWLFSIHFLKTRFFFPNLPNIISFFIYSKLLISFPSSNIFIYIMNYIEIRKCEKNDSTYVKKNTEEKSVWIITF